MSNLNGATIFLKLNLIYYILTIILVQSTHGARIFFAPVNRQLLKSKVLDDMQVLANEEVSDVTRDDLVKIIRKKQFFQDIFSEQPDPMTIQFGHVCENPNEWEQRFEKRDFTKNHYQGKMRWGNKNGDYGEHYWDLGHAG